MGIVVMGCFWLWSCSSGSAGVGGSGLVGTADSSVTEIGVTAVQTLVCKVQPFRSVVKCEGLVKAFQEQVFVAEAAGVVQSFDGVNGRRYRRGETVAVLDGSLLALKLERAVLMRYNADQEYKSQLLAYGDLLKGKSAGLVDSIKKKLSIASGLALAEQDIKETDELLDRTGLKAGFDGVIADVRIKPGMHFNAGDVLFRLYADRDLYLETEVLETSMISMAKGLKARVSALSYPASTFNAVVDNINPYVSDKGMVRLMLRIVGGASKVPLFPGMHGVAEIDTGTGNGLVVPSAALVLRNGKNVVFTVVDGKAFWHDVVLGRDNGRELEILNGLKAGDRVIVSNNAQLTHGSPVTEVTQ
nr:efflux RND transporter periplasmic adaptor subunit [Chitinophaga oryziterrae]